jgi:rfaE bifunctional protein kinase chain/domain
MTTAEILAAIPKLRALVVGDVCLDRWCSYDPALAEPSRETGLARVAVVSTEVTPGAAGTVANNLAALRTRRVEVLGIVGDDGFGYELERGLRMRGIGTELLIRAPQIPTFTYTKLLNARTGAEDLPRLDFVNAQTIPEKLDCELVSRFEQAAPEFDVILVSDQAETMQGGAVTPRLRAALERTAASSLRAVIWVDSRMRAEHFRGVIVKPNQQEAEAACLRAVQRVDFAALRRHMASPLLVITHGGQGALLIHEGGETWAPARHIPNPVDICGAGDSFSAGAALALRITGDPIAAARFGNQVAGVTIMKKGTGSANPEELSG